MPEDNNKIRYSLCSISFDEASGRIGNQVDTLVSSNRTGKKCFIPQDLP
jgi:hypothetical protein